VFLAVALPTAIRAQPPAAKTAEQQTEVHALAPNSSPALKRLSTEPIDQIGKTTSYDPSYQKLDYPNGDVPIETGVCSDVIIRAFRKATSIAEGRARGHEVELLGLSDTLGIEESRTRTSTIGACRI
jgi:uncharacterized protein YijF (DUF1287 family)